MMRIEYEPDFVEQAVFLFARRDGRLERELHRLVDPLYGIDELERREHAFRAAYLEWFRRFGLDRPATDLIAERPLIGASIERCIVRAAARKKAESAELFVRDAESAPGRECRTLVIQVCPQSLVDSTTVVSRLRRELLHVADMLDPTFGYARDALEGRPSTQNLVRDRYHVLWRLYVEMRLREERPASDDLTPRLREDFDRAFVTHGQAPPPQVFAFVAAQRGLTHARLLQWSTDPQVLLTESGVSVSYSGSGPAPGAPCPICEFPTHDWYEFPAAGPDLTSSLRDYHPDWSVGEGLCRRCAETLVAAGIA